MPADASRISRSHGTKVTYITVATFGWFLYALGPSLNLLGAELGASAVVVSLHMTGYAIGIMLGGVITPRLSRRFGRGAALRASNFGIAIGLTLLTFGPNAFATIAATFLLGIPASTSVALGTTFLDEEHADAAPVALAEANLMAAAAGLVSPLVVGACVGLGFGWRPAVWAAVISFLLIEWRRGPLDHFDSNATPIENQHQTSPLPAGYWWAWALLIATVGSEFMLVLWSGPLLADRAGLGSAAAAASLGTFTGGIAVGRALVARLATKIHSEVLLRWAFAIPLVAFWGLWLSRSAAVMLASLFLCGIAMGGHWPLGVARAVRAGRAYPDAAASKTAFASGGATALLPLLLGAASERFGMHTAFLLVPTVLFAGLALLLIRPYPAD